MTNKLIETISAALASDASAAQKHAGAEACRAVLTVLEATPGQPMAPPSSGAAKSPTPAIAGMQMLDLVIAKLQASLPESKGTAPTEQPAQPLVIPFVPVPGAGS